MTVQKCPPGLRHDIFERDEFTCAGCKKGFPEWCLTLQHLIGRGMGASLPDRLRWHPKELISICTQCVRPVTDRDPGFEWLSVSRFGDLDANLDAFWVALGRDWRIA